MVERINEDGLGYGIGLRLGMRLVKFQGELCSDFEDTMAKLGGKTSRPWEMTFQNLLAGGAEVADQRGGEHGEEEQEREREQEDEVDGSPERAVAASRNLTVSWKEAASPRSDDAQTATAGGGTVPVSQGTPSPGAPGASDAIRVSFAVPPPGDPPADCEAENGGAILEDEPLERSAAADRSNDDAGRPQADRSADGDPDEVKAQFVELKFDSPLWDCKNNAKQPKKESSLRIAVVESDGETYVSLADMLEFIRVHNRPNAQSMASNLMGDARKREEWCDFSKRILISY